MIKVFYVWLISVFLLISCDQAHDTKGETIPSAKDFSLSPNPAVTVAYLTNLLQNQEGANLYYLRSKAYFDLRAYQKAEDDIENALNQVPGDVDYLLLSSQIKSQLGMLKEALEDAKLVESSGLASARLYLLLADLHFQLHEKRVALSYLSKTQKAGIPQSERSFFQFISRQVRSDSLGALGSLTGKSIEHPKLAHAYYLYQIGRMSDIQYQKLILLELKKYPMDPYLFLAWGDFLVHVSQFGQAEKVYNQVLLWLPHHPSVRIKMANYFMSRKKYDLAEKQLDQIAKTNFEIRDALYMRALLRLNTGQKAKSIALLDSVRRIYGTDTRFGLLYDRLMGRKLDSTQVKVDSTQITTP